MAIRVITPPAVEPLSLAEAKQHLRIDSVQDDSVIALLITQAREYCENYQNRKYVTQTLELISDGFPRERELLFHNCSPVQSVNYIKYYDTSGNEYVFDPINYDVDIYSHVARVVLKFARLWPVMPLQPSNSVVVGFVAGYGNDESSVPASVKIAMILHLRLLYDDCKPEERKKLEEIRDSYLGMERVRPV